MAYSVHNFEQGDILYASQLNEMDAQIALNEENISTGISADMLAEDYSANKTYSIGDYVIYNDQLYTCIYEITAPEGWNSAHWQIANLGDGISHLNNALNDQQELLTGMEIEGYEPSLWKNILLEPYYSGDAFVNINIAGGKADVIQNTNYHYYTIPTTELNQVKVFAFSGTTIKAAIFVDDNDNLISYYPTDGIPAPGTYVTVICDVPSEATKMYINQQLSPNAVLESKVFEFKYGNELIDTINNSAAITALQIEGYVKEHEEIDGTKKTGYVRAYTSGTEIPIADWEYLAASCSNYKKLYVSGYSGSSVSLYLFANENNEIIEYYPFPSFNTDYENVEVVVPEGATKIYVNGSTVFTHASAKFESMSFVKDQNESGEIGIEISENEWLVGTGKMQSLVSLNGSNNGAFNFTSIQYNDSLFKGCSDDISPINITGVGYIGGNHGYNFVYVATLANHGLSISDIGKTCVVDGDTWVLLKVNSTSEFTVACLDSNVWYGVKTVANPPTTFNFGRSITVTSVAPVSQLYPSIKNKSVEIVENANNAFTVAESYDIINLKSGIDAIIANVGNNDNDSVVSRAESAITVRNLYVFNNESACVISQNLKILNDQVNLSFYGGTQSGGFGSSDYFAVPMTSRESFSATGESQDFLKESWNDQTKPPEIYCQIDNTEANSTRLMLQGFVIANRNSMISNNAGFVYTTRKMYPYAIQPQTTFQSGHTFDIISYRIPMQANDVSSNVKFVGYCQIGSSWYLFCYNPASVSATVTLPRELLGKTVETLIAKNAVCKNGLTVTGVDLEISGSGYILLKLT